MRRSTEDDGGGGGEPVLVVQHAPFEGPGLVADALAARGVPCRIVHAHAGEPVPASIDGARGLVLLGGPMGVYERARYPHLDDELRLTERAIAAEVPIFGICLGSQIVAAALGARVAPAAFQEIGWLPIALAPAAGDDRLFAGIDHAVPLHWHGDAFDLPAGCTSLAWSEATACQAFRHGDRVYGVLCHLEATAAIVLGMVASCGADLRAARVDARALLAATPARLAALAPIARRVLDRWAEMVVLESLG